MAYIGQNADGNFTTSVSKDTFSGNGSTTAFTLSEGATTNTVDVFVENIRQEPTTAYTVDGTTLTFTAAPVTGTNNIYVVNRGPIQLSASHPAAQALTAHSATITTDLTVDTNTLFVDASADAVGINKSAPAIAMDIVAANNSQLRIDSSDTNDTTLFLDYNGGGATNRIRVRNAAGDLAFNVSNTSEAMRIDSSGNLLVGKTSDTSATSTVGHLLGSDGVAVHTRSGAASLRLGRTSSDGEILSFHKDGTTVASIDVSSSDNVSFSATTGGGAGLIFFGSGGTDPTILPMKENAVNDGETDLGRGANRFQDLFLSGSVYLGGTGSANALDDYEEGTFTPTYEFSGGGGSFSYSIQVGRYTKIGRFVFVQIRLRGQKSGTGSGALQVRNLPFNTASVTNLFGTGSIAFTNNWVKRPMGAYIETDNRVTLTKISSSSDTYADLDTTLVDADLGTASTSSNDLILSVVYTV